MNNPVRVVISLHGIKTRGVWQKQLVPELALAGLVPYVLDYGNFSALQLLRSSSLDKQVAWLVKEYDQIQRESGCDTPSVIAHSFGTLQVAHLLEKYDHVMFDKVILAAGIVPLNYPWSDLLNARRVTWVVNDFGGKDSWPKIAGRFAPHAGNSGAAPFTNVHRALHQVSHPHHRHSDYFSKGNFRHNWVPTLLLDKRDIIDNLHTLIGILSVLLGLTRERLRCFVLLVEQTTNYLKVVPGLHLGDTSQREIDAVAVSLDASGLESAPAISYKENREVRQDARELQKLRDSLGDGSSLHKELKWSIALPVPDGDNYEVVAAVLIVDGLEDLQNGVLDNELMADEDVFHILIQIGESLRKAKL